MSPVRVNPLSLWFHIQNFAAILAHDIGAKLAGGEAVPSDFPLVLAWFWRCRIWCDWQAFQLLPGAISEPHDVVT